MKKIILIVAVVLSLTAVIVALLISMSDEKVKNTQETNANLPTGSNEIIPRNTVSTKIIHYARDGELKDVSAPFKAQIENAGLIKLGGTTVVGEYALQDWSDENKAGDALLRRTNNGSWQLITLGGGSWDVGSLVAEGVPKETAEALIEGRGW